MCHIPHLTKGCSGRGTQRRAAEPWALCGKSHVVSRERTHQKMSDYVIHQTCIPESETRDGSPVRPPISLSCPDCAGAWQKQFENAGSLGGRDYFEEATFTHCDRCGRFSIRRHGEYCTNSAGGNWPTSSTTSHRWRSEIERFSISSSEVPVEALRTHLLGKYSDVRSISAEKAEELVLSVFRECYGHAEVRYFRGTTYTADDGIDIAIVDVDAGTIGVQVKRRISRVTEPVAEVRSFITSLFANGMRNGVYVALSSGFSERASQLVENEHLNEIGLSLRLVDCDAFFDMLRSRTQPVVEPPWYSLLKDYRGFADEPHVKKLLRLHTGQTS